MVTEVRRTEAAVQAWLETVEFASIEKLTQQQSEDLLSLVGHPGMKLLLGLLVGERQGLYVQLGNAQLGTAEAAARASVLQGTIKGIDRLPALLLEIVIPAEAEEQEQQQ